MPTQRRFPSPAPELISVEPADTGEPLRNPGMGWVLYHYDNALDRYHAHLPGTDTVPEFPGVGAAYLRVDWADLEPAEGDFRWGLLDAVIQRYRAAGLPCALRLCCCETARPFATPPWVRAAGALGHWFRPGDGVLPAAGTTGAAAAPAPDAGWEPDYDDPVFLAKLETFLRAAAARYDGAPEIAFIDVGSFGVWGEGHTYWSTRLPYGSATVIRHIELHRRLFPRSLLVANHTWRDHDRGPAAIEHALAAGLAFRTDSLQVLTTDELDSHDLAARFHPSRPVILETHHYGMSVADGVWNSERLVAEVGLYGASYLGVHWFPREFLAAEPDTIAAINLRLGYRLVVERAEWPAQAVAGGPWTLRLWWRNHGVAPCLPGGCLAITIKDLEGGCVHLATAASPEDDARGLAPGAPARLVELHAAWPATVGAGDYEVFVSVGNALGTPRIALPLAGHDGGRRYLLGRVRLSGARPAGAPALPPERVCGDPIAALARAAG